MNRRQGLIHVYTGDGKGKTTAALGLALRAAGHGMKVCMIMFLKGRYLYGERNSAKHIPGFQIEAYGQKHFIKSKPGREDIEEAEEAFERAISKVKAGECDILILDELTHAINLGMIRLDQVMELINGKPEGLELVITGRDCPPEIIEAADYVTEFVERKHPYRRGIKSRKGIEY
ncbi:cob(I)yrinic acid a,c-diamide adenosyltransferase [Candidatus Bathyarchaeota archaeon]|nr:cob(I)yrinic acid a,c-diamide adenosyltransferase [Candidatus Bathyarchaeota archaeon]MBS7628609.1 cob(I)yrinic acid a,c-diamide adenosyltransferase [Candidatus Bathyarchaeota archaeon]